MKHHISTGLYIGVGFLNFAPLVGIAGQEQLSALYGVSGLYRQSPELLLLLQHRALLFGIIGGFMLLSAFKVHYRPQAAVMGLLSMAGFILLYQTSAPKPSLESIYQADIAGLFLLSIAVVLDRKNRQALL